MGNPINANLELLSENQTLYPFDLAPLPYSYDALEPYFDTLTMETHYDKHHRAYRNNFKNFYDQEVPAGTSLMSVFKHVSTYSSSTLNNGGGFINHTIFWKLLTPNSSLAPVGDSANAIISTFGSFDNFKQQFHAAAMGRFGSGWAWLNMAVDGSLFISSTPNQVAPFMDIAEQQGLPLLTIDVWEHSYYLKYKNLRADYINNFWNVVNWAEVERRFQEAKKILNTK
jgi:Fe-Mn family superoxide dismutase